MKRILIINGPNLNMLGRRDKKHYGNLTLKEINSLIKNGNKDLKFKFFQSNYEGKIVTVIQKSLNKFDAIVINPGAFTHTSVAIHDALEMFNGPIIEVHLSDVDNREDYRKINYIRPLSTKVFSAKFENSYLEAINYLKNV